MAVRRNQNRGSNNPSTRGSTRKKVTESRSLALRLRKIPDPEPQKSFLPSLPVEILEMIIKDDSLDFEDHWSLRRVSSRLFHMSENTIFQGGKFRMFRYALEHADVDVMNKCAELSLPPKDITWDYEDYRKDVPPQSENSLPQGPGYFLLEGLRRQRFSADQYIKAAEWLMNHGFKVCNPSEESIWNSCLEGYFISYRLFDILTATRNKKDQEGICRIIEFLRSRGYEFVLRNCMGDTGRYKTEAETLIHDNSFGAFRRCYDRPTLMLIMMRSGCPASILELYLKQLQEDGMCLKGFVSSRHEEKRNGNIRYYSQTEVAQLIDIYLDELFGLWNWQWETPEQMGDALEAKIKLLVRYKAIDEAEEALLKDILAALRRIEAKNRNQGGLDYQRDASWCWTELFMSVTDITRKRNRTFDQHEKKRYSRPWKCLHEFIHTIYW
ncbi:hypothetical protein FLONG3_8027 [Fusarium longipes]|uniref:F-box domain-containing protein n=1 Tax=Fusarium longipes TaxID=694270 RepID=A0A395S8K9_9HYPO|nr:hypothetical protein FLONG3_8027 [Fusarium longipes]